jgi:hypothetical protein
MCSSGGRDVHEARHERTELGEMEEKKTLANRTRSDQGGDEAAAGWMIGRPISDVSAMVVFRGGECGLRICFCFPHHGATTSYDHPQRMSLLLDLHMFREHIDDRADSVQPAPNISVCCCRNSSRHIPLSAAVTVVVANL